MSLFSKIFKKSPLRKTLLGGLAHKGVEGLQRGELFGGAIKSKALERIGKDFAGLPGVRGTFDSANRPGGGPGVGGGWLGPAGMPMGMRMSPDDVGGGSDQDAGTPSQIVTPTPLDKPMPMGPIGRPGQFDETQTAWLASLSPEDRAKEIAAAEARHPRAGMPRRDRMQAVVPDERGQVPPMLPGGGPMPMPWMGGPGGAVSLPKGALDFDWTQIQASTNGPQMPMMNSDALLQRKQSVGKKISDLVGRAKRPMVK